MQNIQSEIHQLIQQALEALQLPIPERIQLEHPANAEHGEWSTNIALVSFKGEGKRENRETGKQEFGNPRELAQSIVEEVKLLLPVSNIQSLVSSVEIAGPGFINFTLSHEFYVAEMGKIVSQQAKMASQTKKGKRVLTEFTDPNPFKEFHIGHLYSNSVGESIARTQDAIGATVRRVCYQGDVGMHVAKSLWGAISLLADKDDDLVDSKVIDKVRGRMVLELGEKPVSEKVKFWGKAYATGATAYEESESAKEQMKELNRMVFEKNPQVFPLYEFGKEVSLQYFETIYGRLGTQFEKLYFESVVAGRGIALVKKYLEEGIFEESDGAIIFSGSKYGLHDRVFINSLGLPTYEAKELGLAPTKYDDWNYDESIIITGNEIKEYFKVLMKVMSLIPELRELEKVTTHLTHGMVRLPDGKMSSRTGKILTGEWLLDEAKAKIQNILTHNKPDIALDQKEEISERLAVASVKYALLKNSIGSDIKFDFEESVSFEGNSGPYLQYTYARCKSVLRKAEGKRKKEKETSIQYPISTIELNSDEVAVLRQLSRFGETVDQAASEYAPHHICTYLFHLAQAFNSFYAKNSILGKPENGTTEENAFRVEMTEAVSLVIQEGLRLLGIETVEEM